MNKDVLIIVFGAFSAMTTTIFLILLLMKFLGVWK